MSVEPVVTFKGMPPSADLLWDIRDRAVALARSFRPVRSCEVMLDSTEGGRAPARVTVQIELPGRTVVADAQPGLRDAAGQWARRTFTAGQARTSERQLQDTIRDAFDRARRQVQRHIDARTQTRRSGVSGRGMRPRLTPVVV